MQTSCQPCSSGLESHSSRGIIPDITNGGEGNETTAVGKRSRGPGRLGGGRAVASAYPGTPSTEILENFGRYPNVYAEWAPNEKVALDVAIGAAYAGSRAMAVMKHVGLNVAADAFSTPR